jgi:hypothetical protein
MPLIENLMLIKNIHKKMYVAILFFRLKIKLSEKNGAKKV